MPKGSSRSTYSEKIAERLLDRVADGATLSAASAACRVPRQTVRSWLGAIPAFSEAFDAACRVRIEVLAEQLEARANEALDVAKQAAAAGLNENAAIAALRCELENKRWLLAKLDPRRYGDRNQVEMTGADGAPLIPEPLDTSKMALALLCVLNNAPGGRNDPARLEASQPLPSMASATTTMLSGPSKPVEPEPEPVPEAAPTHLGTQPVFDPRSQQNLRPLFNTATGKLVRFVGAGGENG